MGPSLNFDKSFLQSLSVDEAAILDQLYQCIITPVFYVETLGTLGKGEDERRSPDKVVAGLAERTPVCHSAINEAHWRLLADSLQGYDTGLNDPRPRVPGGIPVRVDGNDGVVFEKAPETEAFERWQRGRFADVERYLAQTWRVSVGGLDLTKISSSFKAQLRKEELPKSLEDAKALAVKMVDGGGVSFRTFQVAMDAFSVPMKFRSRLIAGWKKRGKKPLRDDAPYAAYCLEVLLFFYFAMSNGLISDQRPSNLVDITYLFYLPFGQVFVSSDKLHRRVVPLFMTDRQEFVWGPELKADLANAQKHFSELPDEEKAKGLFQLAKAPPPSAAQISAHWDQFRPGWKKTLEREPQPTAVSAEATKRIIGTSNAFMAAAAARRIELDAARDPQNVVIQRFIPRERGSWRMFSKEVEDQEDKRHGG